MPPIPKKTTSGHGQSISTSPTSVPTSDLNQVVKKALKKRGGPKRPYKKIDMHVLVKHVETFTKRASLSEKRLKDAIIRSDNAQKKFDYHNNKLTGYSAELEFRKTDSVIEEKCE